MDTEQHCHWGLLSSLVTLGAWSPRERASISPRPSSHHRGDVLSPEGQKAGNKRQRPEIEDKGERETGKSANGIDKSKGETRVRIRDFILIGQVN